MATRERSVRRRSGTAPGSRPLSRTAAPISVTAPAKRKAPSPRSAAPSALSSARRRVATAMTGTSAVPDPAAPSTVTCTLYEPPLINQRAALYRVESPGTCWPTSGGGGAAVWGSQYTGSTSTRRGRAPWGSGESRRTVIWASPGTTPGVRTITRTAYGPAAPSKYVSGLPTWADAISAMTATAASRPARPVIAADRPSNSPTTTRLGRSRPRAPRRSPASRG